MHTRFIPNGTRTLLVYFAGWGTPFSAVGHLRPPENASLLLCGSYRSLKLDFDFGAYREIRMVAWSMGVWVAERAMQGVPLVSATAVNGTPMPKHDRFGIPAAVFEATLEHLDDAGRLKFEQRMCGGKAGWERYRALDGHRTLPEIRDELAFLNDAVSQDERSGLIRWTHAFTGSRDRIFSAENQTAYWQNRCPQTVVGGGSHNLFPHWGAWAELWP
ncbi:DUF452 family protein [Neisseria sp.]|uniref:DUF452 family protein n=1 Tax=Neisseria sp. TaxID=192066 RepID=UPI0035A04ADD